MKNFQNQRPNGQNQTLRNGERKIVSNYNTKDKEKDKENRKPYQKRQRWIPEVPDTLVLKRNTKEKKEKEMYGEQNRHEQRKVLAQKKQNRSSLKIELKMNFYYDWEEEEEYEEE